MTTVRQRNKEVDRRLKRNHYNVSSHWPLSVFGDWMMSTPRKKSNLPQRPSSASERASNAAQQYRFGKVNCVRSVTQIQGDDMSVLEDE